MTTTQHPVPHAHWLVPGSPALAILLPDLVTEDNLLHAPEHVVYMQIEHRLRKVVEGAMNDLGIHSPSSFDDMIQELAIRIATMNAAPRFDPSLASPATYLRAIARMLVREQFYRRERPVAISGDAIDRMARGGSQLDRAVEDERRQELKRWLDQLSPGELRAVIHEFGPIADYSPPSGPRRRVKNPDALPRAIEILSELSAH